MPAISTVDEFLGLLDESNLLTAEQSTSVRQFGRREEDPRDVAKELVKRNWITRWQAQQLLAGHSKLFLGRYKLLDAIGKGGMGVVFKAEQPALGRIVALKVMSKELLKSPAAITRFAREIQTVGSLSHPSIVAAHDAHCVDDTHFLVMEYVEGRNLKAWVKEHGPLPVAWACEVCRQVALGLQHAHERGMVHRDIKPSNILLAGSDPSAPPLIKILDFGMARFLSETHRGGELTQTGEVMGTPDYIAPEQARSTKDADIRSDIYSLGCTLFELLTGRVPFDGRNVMEKLLARATAEPPHVATLRPDIPPAIDTIVYHMMAREPSQRYQTPNQVAAALAPFCSTTAAQMASISPLLPQPVPVHSPTLSADTDDTLQGFISQLANRAQDSSPLKTRSSLQLPKARRRSSLDRTALLKWSGMAAGSIALLLTVWMFLSKQRSKSTPPRNAPRFVVEEFSETSANGNTSSPNETADHSVAKWALSIRGSIQLEVNGAVRDFDYLPQAEFKLVGINLLNNSQVADGDLEQLASLTILRRLLLRGTRISDAGASLIGKLQTLTELNLSETEVGDAGLDALGSLSNLGQLTLIRTRVTAEGVRKLRQRLPSCDVIIQ